MDYRVWYDEFELRVGDSLRQSIDKGLVNSRFGIGVLSPAFFAKNWPQYELNGLTAREMDGHKVILPIWHNVDREDVLGYSPTLADKIALSSRQLSIKKIAEALGEELDSE
jgi:TIR domain-containing protein